MHREIKVYYHSNLVFIGRKLLVISNLLKVKVRYNLLIDKFLKILITN